MSKFSKFLKVILLSSLVLLSFFSIGKVYAASTNFEEDIQDTLESGWHYKDDHYYYLNLNGEKEKGWLKVKNSWYYMDESAVMQTGWLKIKDDWFYLKANGAMHRGWAKVKNKWYFMDNSGRMQTGWQKIDGDWFYLRSSGVMETGWTKENNRWYYMNNSGRMQTGWQKIDGDWFYLRSSGVMETGWAKVKNHWYYMNKGGYMQTGWQKIKGKWYYLRRSGAMQTKPITLSGIAYSFYPSGALKSSKDIGVRNLTPKYMNHLGNSQQVILVTTKRMNSYNAGLRTFEKEADGQWKQLVNTKAYIGKNGFTDNKREGDMKTPTGKYTIGHAFGHARKPDTRLDFRYATANDVWVDDVHSKYYNSWQQRNRPNKDWKSAEAMNHELYKYAFTINYNTEQIPGAGSAIFMHLARPSTGYTAGCIATNESALLKILSWINPDKQPVIIQDAESHLNRY